MELTKRDPDINPIVCLDNEDQVIQQSVKFHFRGQMTGFKPKAEVKVQSIDKARKDEPKGYRVADVVCSLLGNYVKSPSKYGILLDLVSKTIKFESRLEIEPVDNIHIRANFKTENVRKWVLETQR